MADSAMAAPIQIATVNISESKSWIWTGVKGILGVTVIVGIPTVLYKTLVYYLKRKVESIREENVKFFQNHGSSQHEGVSIESLTALCKSTHSNLRRCAQLLAIEKCLNNEKALNLIFHQCLHGTREQIERATMIFCNALLAADTEVETRPLSYRKAIVQSLAYMIIQSAEPDFSTDIHFRNRIQKLALQGAMHVYTFPFLADIEASDPLPEALFADLCRSLLACMKESRNRDVHRLVLTVLSVIAGEGQLEEAFVNADGIVIVAETLRAHQGDAVFQRICLQMINVNMKYVNVDESRDKLIHDCQIIKPVLMCLKSEDPICINLASTLLYHLSVPSGDACIKEIKSVPSGVRILTRALCNNDSKQRCLMLRIIFKLAVDDSEFKQQVLQCSELLEKLALLYLSPEVDIVSSALALTECLMLEGREAVLAMLNASPHLLRHLSSLSLTSHHDTVIVRMAAEILCLCTSEDVVEESVQAGVLSTIMQFIQTSQSDTDLLTQFAAMLLNIALASDAMKTEMMRCGALHVLMTLVFSGSGSSSGPGRILASRTLIMLGSNDRPCSVKVKLSESSGTVYVDDQHINFYNQGTHLIRFDTAHWTLKYTAASSSFQLCEEPGILYVIIVNKFQDLPTFLNDIEMDKCNAHVIISHSVVNERIEPIHSVSLIVGAEESFEIGLDILVKNLVCYKLVELTKRAILATRSPISKVAELNISQCLVHDRRNAEAYLSINGSVDYLLDMVSAVVDAIPQMENLDPVIAMFAHGIAALEMIEVLVKHDRFYQIECNIVCILVQLLQQMNRLSLNNALSSLNHRQQQLYNEYQDIFVNLTKHAVYTIQQILCRNQVLMREKLLRSGGHYMVWSALMSVKVSLQKEIAIPASWSLATLFAERSTPSDDICRLNLGDKTPALQLAPSLLEAKNGSWTFESVRATHSTKDVTLKEGITGWYYEATIQTAGIIQLGWATRACPFRAQKGHGVGDDPGSVAFDGERCKKWNGLPTPQTSNNYGKPWRAGDVISCLLSVDGTASYMLNGQDLGPAFLNLPMDSAWYPAASLATDQQVAFNFGAVPFRYRVEGYQHMSSANRQLGSASEPEGEITLLKNLIIPYSKQRRYHVPMLYFEVNLCARSSALNIGMQTYASQRAKVFCSYENNTLKFPCGKVVKNLMDLHENIPVTIGVGYLLHQRSLFFVVDGTPLKKTYEIEGGAKAPVVPYLSSAFVDVNFGSRFFVYDSANDSNLRLGCAALLLDYSDIRNH